MNLITMGIWKRLENLTDPNGYQIHISSVMKHRENPPVKGNQITRITGKSQGRCYWGCPAFIGSFPLQYPVTPIQASTDQKKPLHHEISIRLGSKTSSNCQDLPHLK